MISSGALKIISGYARRCFPLKSDFQKCTFQILKNYKSDYLERWLGPDINKERFLNNKNYDKIPLESYRQPVEERYANIRVVSVRDLLTLSNSTTLLDINLEDSSIQIYLRDQFILDFEHLPAEFSRKTIDDFILSLKVYPICKEKPVILRLTRCHRKEDIPP